MVKFFYVFGGKQFDSQEHAAADRESLLVEGYDDLGQIEEYALIDGQVYSANEGRRELAFQSAAKLAEERNSLIDFIGQE